MSEFKKGDSMEVARVEELNQGIEEVKAGVPARIVDQPQSPPEVLTAEAAKAVKGFMEILYGTELGELNIPALTQALARVRELGGDPNLNDGYTGSRLVDEVKVLLCWLPSRDSSEPSVWLEHPDVTAREKNAPSLPRVVMDVFEHAVKSTLMRYIPKNQELDRVQEVIDFAKNNDIEVDWNNSKTVNVFESALTHHKYIGDPIDFIRLIDAVGIHVEDSAKAYALEDEIAKRLDGIGFGSNSIREVEDVALFAGERGIILNMNDNEVLKGRLFDLLDQMIERGRLDVAQVLLDFRKRHNIVISNGIKARIGMKLETLGHKGRQNLNLERIDEVLDFGKRNDIDHKLSADMLARWRTQIPDLIRRRDEKQKLGGY